MAEGSEEQNRSEEATPFKLERARAKGSVARGIDLGFFASLAAFGGFAAVAGAALLEQLAEMMRRALALGIPAAADPQAIRTVIGVSTGAPLHGVMLLGGTVIAVVLLFEIVQLRGIVFSAQPLKPDFSKINPAKGLKRLFSLRMLKEAAKSIVKLAVYTTATVLLIRAAVSNRGAAIDDAASLTDALHRSGMRMLWVFVLLALAVAAFDQFLARREFGKQMRMSRREVMREGREREGDPRQKRKRKQLHAQFVKTAKGFGAVAGSDLLVVNPEHYAVALKYDREVSSAPVVAAKGRNLHALAMKRQATRAGVPVLARPALARALFAEHEIGAEITADFYHRVAELYFTLGEAAAGVQPEVSA